MIIAIVNRVVLSCVSLTVRPSLNDFFNVIFVLTIMYRICWGGTFFPKNMGGKGGLI